MTSHSPPRTALRRGLLVGLLFAALLPGCRSEPASRSSVARVGNQHLTEEDVARMLSGMGPTPDSATARQQIVEQWITRALLYREAERLDLESTEEVQQKLEQQRKSILVSTMKSRIYDEVDVAPSKEEVRTYFERHKDRLRLRGPYVRVYYLTTQTDSAAQAVRRVLRESPPSPSLWQRLVRRHAADSARSARLSGRFLPVGRLAQEVPYTADQLTALDVGTVAPVVRDEQRYHVLSLAKQLSADTEPKLKWFEEEIRRRLRIRARKQIYTREVQGLRSKARADGALELP